MKFFKTAPNVIYLSGLVPLKEKKRAISIDEAKKAIEKLNRYIETYTQAEIVEHNFNIDFKENKNDIKNS